MGWSHWILGASFYHYDFATGHVVSFTESTVSVRRGAHNVLDKWPAEEVLFYDTAKKIYAAASAKVYPFFRMVDGVPPDD